MVAYWRRDRWREENVTPPVEYRYPG